MKKWCVFLGILSVFAISCNKEDVAKSKKGGRTPALSAVIIKTMEIPRSVRGLASVLPGEFVEIKSEISGRVQQLLFKEGRVVEKGALLVKLSDVELQANRAKAIAKVDLAQANYNRKQQQFELQSVSKQDLEQSAAELASAKADLAILDAQIAKTEIRAPFAGKVGFERTSTGAVISSGQVLTTLVQQQPWKLEFSIPNDYVTMAQVGAKLEFQTATGSGLAEIYAIEGALDESTRSLPVRAHVVGKNNQLVPGTTVPFTLKGAPLQAMLVPPDALAGSAKGVVLYVYRGGKAIPQPVELGMRTAEQVQVLQGVKEGDTVLCVGAVAIRPNSKVDLLGIR